MTVKWPTLLTSCFLVCFCYLQLPAASPVNATMMRDLGIQAGKGDKTAVDRIEVIHDELYRDLDREKDRKRLVSNAVLMKAAFEEIGQAVKGDGKVDDLAFQSLIYATGKKSLSGYTAKAFGIAAANGHRPSLDVLLNHDEHGILLSSAVFAFQKPAEKGIPQAVEFLIKVIDDDTKSALWYGASEGLVGEANRGNERAKQALAKYAAFNKANRSKLGK